MDTLFVTLSVAKGLGKGFSHPRFFVPTLGTQNDRRGSFDKLRMSGPRGV